MLEVSQLAPGLTLRRLDGSQWDIDPTSAVGPTLLIFFETDCPTCQLVVPYLNRLAAKISGSRGALIGISQDSEDRTRQAVDQFPFRFPVGIDEGLKASRQYDPLAVPTMFLIGDDGSILKTQTGFDKLQLNSIAESFCSAIGVESKAIAAALDGLPDSRPGCTSRHLEGGVTDGETAMIDLYSQSGQPASRVELADDVDPYEFCIKSGFTNTLPVVPPTEERVQQMLDSVGHSAEEVVGRIPPNYGAATVEKIAANAVMAGCQPELMRVLVPLIRATCDENFNIHGVQATTHFAAPMVILNGPVRQELGFNSGQNVFSNVARTNSTLGRAWQLILTNIGGGRPDTVDMSAQGNSAKFSCCIAENEEQNPWEPFHVERGFTPEQSTVTLFAAEPPRGVSEHVATSARQVLRAVSRSLVTVWSYRVCMAPPAIVALGPEHAKTIANDGFSKSDVREFLFENTGVPLRAYTDEEQGEGTAYTKFFEEVIIDGEPCYRKFHSPEAIQIIVTGGTAGKFSAVLGGWGAAMHGSQIVTYPID